MKKEIKPEDLVHVTDWGGMFPSYIPWFKDHRKMPIEWAIRYAYEDEEPFERERFADNATYVVLYVDQDKALITPDRLRGKVYLIEIDSLASIES